MDLFFSAWITEESPQLKVIHRLCFSWQQEANLILDMCFSALSAEESHERPRLCVSSQQEVNLIIAEATIIGTSLYNFFSASAILLLANTVGGSQGAIVFKHR